MNNEIKKLWSINDKYPNIKKLGNIFLRITKMLILSLTKTKFFSKIFTKITIFDKFSNKSNNTLIFNIGS